MQPPLDLGAAQTYRAAVQARNGIEGRKLVEVNSN
jgi:hypothetical protein